MESFDVGPWFLSARIIKVRESNGGVGNIGVDSLCICSRGSVLSARIVKFVVESVVTGSAIGQSLLGSGKGVGQSSLFTVGIGPGRWSRGLE